MSEKRPHVYQRRQYNPERHCGQPKDRSLEALRGKVERGEARFAERSAAISGRDPTVAELTILKRIGSTIAFNKRALEKIEKYGPDDRPCMNLKGMRTDHPGVNLCYRCCECKGKKGFHLGKKFSYSPRKTAIRLKGYMDAMMVANHDLMDMEPDVLLLRAKVQDFTEELGDALDPESIKSLAVLMEQIRKTVDSMQDKKFKTMMSMDVFNLINGKMGLIVEEFVKDPEILEKILQKWSMIQIETGSKRTQELIAGKRE